MKARAATYFAGGFWKPAPDKFTVWIKPISSRVQETPDGAVKRPAHTTGEMTTVHITPRNDPTGYFARKFALITQRDLPQRQRARTRGPR
jgi:hypothetical protein